MSCESGIKARTLYLMLSHGEELGMLDQVSLFVQADGKTYPVSALSKGDGTITLIAKTSTEYANTLAKNMIGKMPEWCKHYDFGIKPTRGGG